MSLHVSEKAFASFCRLAKAVFYTLWLQIKSLKGKLVLIVDGFLVLPWMARLGTCVDFMNFSMLLGFGLNSEALCERTLVKALINSCQCQYVLLPSAAHRLPSD